MSTQTKVEVSSVESQVIDRQTDELIVVALGFVTKLWEEISEEAGILPTINHELLQSTKTQLGEIASRRILDYNRLDQDFIIPKYRLV